MKSHNFKIVSVFFSTRFVEDAFGYKRKDQIKIMYIVRKKLLSYLTLGSKIGDTVTQNITMDINTFCLSSLSSLAYQFTLRLAFFMNTRQLLCS